MSNDEVMLYDTEKASEQPKQIKTFELIPPNWPPMSMVLPEFNFEKPPVDPDSFASSLVETCIKNNALGLSANQCGYPYRVFVMGAGENFIACFNPKIISSEGEAHLSEGCATFPLLEFKITRAKSVTVEYQDWQGTVHQQTFTGLTARIFQHELDHMNGMLYTDRVKPLALQAGVKRLEKLKRKYFNPKVMNKLNGKTTTKN